MAYTTETDGYARIEARYKAYTVLIGFRGATGPKPSPENVRTALGSYMSDFRPVLDARDPSARESIFGEITTVEINCPSYDCSASLEIIIPREFKDSAQYDGFIAAMNNVCCERCLHHVWRADNWKWDWNRKPRPTTAERNILAADIRALHPEITDANTLNKFIEQAWSLQRQLEKPAKLKDIDRRLAPFFKYQQGANAILNSLGLGAADALADAFEAVAAKWAKEIESEECQGKISDRTTADTKTKSPSKPDSVKDAHDGGEISGLDSAHHPDVYAFEHSDHSDGQSHEAEKKGKTDITKYLKGHILDNKESSAETTDGQNPAGVDGMAQPKSASEMERLMANSLHDLEERGESPAKDQSQTGSVDVVLTDGNDAASGKRKAGEAELGAKTAAIKKVKGENEMDVDAHAKNEEE